MKYQSTTYERGVLAEGREGKNEGEYNIPRAIAFDDTTQQLFIAEYGNSRIVVCSSTGKYLHQFGKGILYQPCGLLLAPDCLYTTDSNTLFKFTWPEYQLMVTTGEYGSKEGQFNYPRQLAINPANGFLYVCDSRNDRLSVYSPDFQYQYSITDEAMKHPTDVKFNNNKMFALCNDSLIVNV